MNKWINRQVKFWETIKPIFTDKTLNDERTTLHDGDKIKD